MTFTRKQLATKNGYIYYDDSGKARGRVIGGYMTGWRSAKLWTVELLDSAWVVGTVTVRSLNNVPVVLEAFVLGRRSAGKV